MSVSARDAAIPRAGVAGVAGGLILMAVFTALWGSWASVGVPGIPAVIIAVVFFGILGLCLLLFTAIDPFLVWTIVGVATASATSAYGVYMIAQRRSILARVNSGS